MNISEKIKKFRTEKTLSMQQLADLAGLSKASIQQYEDGTTSPSVKALQSLADALHIGLWDFFSTQDIHLELAEFRHGEKLADTEAEKLAIHDRIINYCKSYLELELLLNAQVEFENPISDYIISNPAEAETAAQKLRKNWKLHQLAVDDICGLLEDRGFKIISFDRETDSPGLCGFIREDGKTIPFIILNNFSEHTKELTRKRFTIIHELAHLVCRFAYGISNEQKEKLCNRFASAFLLPADAIREFLGTNRISISLEELKMLKQKSGLSVMSIIYRSNEIGLINNETCQQWIELYNGWRKEGKEFGQFQKSKEEPARLKRLISRALSEKRITKEKVAELFNIPLDRIDEIYGKDRFNLN